MKILMHLNRIIVSLIILVTISPPVFSQGRQNTNQYQGTENADLAKKITELEIRIRELEKAAREKESADELENLLREAETLKAKKKETDTSINRVFKGTERHQPQLNPEISVTGDFFASYTSSDAAFITEPGDFTSGRNCFEMRDVGFHFVAPLDPFTRGKFFLGIPGTGDVSLSELVDEAYIEWLNLPGGVNLKIGQYFHQFGILNRYHDHGLPQVERPSALNNLFAGNLGGFGVSGNVLLPKLWADVNELDIGVSSSGDGFSFDDAYDNFIGVAHLKNYYDLTRNTYLEVGLSGAHGYNDKDANNATTIAGVDLTCKWVPAGRSHYRTTEFRSEFFYSSREEDNDTLDRYGFYSYIKNRLSARSWVGLRYSYSELPFEMEKKTEWDISPTFDYWQSEFVMYRLQYSYTDRSYNEDDHTIFIHAVWSMGPHKHEAY